MTERTTQKTRKEELLAAGIPLELTAGMLSNGFQQDYFNTWVKTYAILQLDRQFGSKLKKPQIQDYIKKTQTYRDYWKSKIQRYNDQQEDNKKIDEEHVLPLLVDEQPGIELIDELIQRAHAFADNKALRKTQLVNEYVRLAVKAVTLFDDEEMGERRQKEMLSSFGI